MQPILNAFYQKALKSIVLLFIFTLLASCESTSSLSMESVGRANEPIKKVLISSRSTMSLRYREQHQGFFVSVVKDVLDKHNVKWTYSDNPRLLFNAHKKKELSHTLFISTRQKRSYYRGTKRILDGYTLTLSLTELRQRDKVWEGEFINEDVVEQGENDRIKMEQLVTDHFILAGIIAKPTLVESN